MLAKLEFIIPKYLNQWALDDHLEEKLETIFDSVYSLYGREALKIEIAISKADVQQDEVDTLREKADKLSQRCAVCYHRESRNDYGGFEWFCMVGTRSTPPNPLPIPRDGLCNNKKFCERV